MRRSDDISELVKALAIVQGQLKSVPKTQENPYFKSRYASLADLWDVARPLLTKNDLAILQTADYDNGTLVLETTLAHASGQWAASFLPLSPVPDKDGRVTPQAIGSAITYTRRQGFAALVGLTSGDDDDDGEGASEHQAPRQSPAKRPIPTGQGKPDTMPRAAPAKPDFSMVDNRPHEVIAEVRQTPTGKVTNDPATPALVGAVHDLLRAGGDKAHALTPTQIDHVIRAYEQAEGGLSMLSVMRLYTALASWSKGDQRAFTARRQALLTWAQGQQKTQDTEGKEQDDGDQEADMFHPGGVEELDEGDEAERS